MTKLTISDAGLELIKKSEGLKLSTYLDSAGVLTIGYGHTGKDVQIAQYITMDQAGELLRRDVASAETAVRHLVTAPLTQGQFDALVSFTFNLGSGALSKSTLLRLLNAGDYAGAADQFSRWVFAGGRKLAGLVARREAERKLFLS